MARHRPQRLASPAPSFSLLLHLLGIASFGYNFYFLTTWETPFTHAYGWHFQFLTIIGLAAALVCFTLGALADLMRSPGFFHAKNAVSVLATPLEVVISVLYWGIRANDPELLVQDGFELPFLEDVGFHLAPVVFLTLDLILLSPPWTMPAYGTMALSTVLAFGYWYWVELCFAKNGWYTYPLFGVLSTPQRVLLFVFSAALVTVSSSILKWIYASVSGYDEARRPHKPLKKME
ncbi:membrane protein [Tolypocladium ophioglossoides CBS 100239]|uniref:Membrane protein n=1 Tax=Tolypocladium ophioglossoides (strain CBS 100239) TaxID=1163406 RepID=A0A0L0NL76_TOLOC|nr:membrane protein [Tolypocladium ophioglossoides CBS 100239]